MKHLNYKLFIYGVLFFAYSEALICQKTVSSVYLDSMECVLEDFSLIDSFEAYYHSLKELEDEIKNSKAYELINSTDRYYNYHPKTRADSSVYREFLMRHGYNIREYNNDYYGSIDFYIKAHAHVLDHKYLDKWCWWIENNLGNIYARLNDYDKAIYYYNLCVPRFVKENDIDKLVLLYANLGNGYKWLREFDKMKELFDLGIQYCEKTRNYQGLNSIHSNYASYYLENKQLDRCKFHIDQSLAALREVDKIKYSLDRHIELWNLKAAYFAQTKEYDQAIELYQKSVDSLSIFYKDKPSREIAKIYELMSRIYLSQRDVINTNVVIQRAFEKLIDDYNGEQLPTQAQIFNENTFTDLLNVKSRYYALKFERSEEVRFLDSAMMAVDLALEANNQLDSMLLMQNSKFASIHQNKKLINKGILYSYQALKYDSKYIKKARRYIDWSKSKLLLAQQEKNNLINQLSVDEKLEIASIEWQLIGLMNKQHIDAMIITQRKTELHGELDEILNKYPTKQFTYTDVTGPCLEYVEGDSNYFLYANTPEEQLIKLGDKEMINRAISTLNSDIKQRKRINLDEQLEDLKQLLIPINLGDENELIIIPDGMVSFVPFDILKEKGSYLIEEKIISIQHNQLMVDHVKAKRNDIQMFILQPHYKKKEVPLYAVQERGEITYLPNAKLEVEQIQQNFDANYSIQHVISLERLKKQISLSDIFHFAGHAIVKSDTSMMALIDENDTEISLQLDQVIYLRNDLDLVTLSACETGVGEYKNGEGVRSMANGFLHSGAKSIVYSLWNANDVSTAQIMTYFYEYLNRGETKSKALNLAKLAYLKTADPEQRHPYYWAAFVLAGDTTSLVNTDYMSKYGWILLALLALLIYIFYTQKLNNYEN